MQNVNKTKRLAVLTGAFLLLLCAFSLWSILASPKKTPGCVAEIYQDGKLLTSIPLDGLQEPYTFTLTAGNGGINQVEVRPGSIGIVFADCPDRLCVRQGFLGAPGIPIVCLPHRLVIQLRPADSEETDLVSY